MVTRQLKIQRLRTVGPHQNQLTLTIGRVLDLGKWDQRHELTHVRVRPKNTGVVPCGCLGELPNVIALGLPPTVRDGHFIASVRRSHCDHVVNETHRSTDRDVSFLRLRLKRWIPSVPNDRLVVAVLNHKPLERIDRPPNLKIIPKT